jgi:hypothetical protein
VSARREGAAPRFSVLLPTHNRADVLGYAIESVLAQSVPDFELLVVGDGCTDLTADVVRSYADPRVRWFDLPKAPYFGYANRNVALREARGELMAFMAHDDLMLPDHLERLGAAFEIHGVEWAYSRPLWVSDDGYVVPFAVDLRRPDHFREFMNTRNTIPASAVVYRRSCHERYGMWPETSRGAGDWALWKAILGPSHGAKLAYVEQPTTLHFRAAWRQGQTWGPAPLTQWLDTARSGDWPAGLRLPVSDGQAPQQVFARHLAQHPEWLTTLRASLAGLFEQLAWQGGIALAAQAATPTPQLPSDAPAPTARPPTRRGRRRGAHRASPRLLLRHLLTRARLHVGGNPLFDGEWYHERNPDVPAAEAERHWRRIGLAQGRDPNRLFNTRWYLARYPEVARQGMNPLDHYLLYGGLEGRAPSPEFDGAWYLRTYPEVRRQGINPLLHYLRWGKREGRRISADQPLHGGEPR